MTNADDKVRAQAGLILDSLESLCDTMSRATSTKSVVSGLIVTLARYIDACAKDDADFKDKLENVLETLRECAKSLRKGAAPPDGD